MDEEDIKEQLEKEEGIGRIITVIVFMIALMVAYWIIGDLKIS